MIGFVSNRFKGFSIFGFAKGFNQSRWSVCVCAPNVDTTRRSGFREFFFQIFLRGISEKSQIFNIISQVFQNSFRSALQRWVGGREGRGQTVRPKNKAEILGANERHSGWRQTLQQTALSKPAAEERFADLADLHRSKSENYEVHHGIPQLP